MDVVYVYASCERNGVKTLWCGIRKRVLHNGCDWIHRIWQLTRILSQCWRHTRTHAHGGVYNNPLIESHWRVCVAVCRRNVPYDCHHDVRRSYPRDSTRGPSVHATLDACPDRIHGISSSRHVTGVRSTCYTRTRVRTRADSCAHRCVCAPPTRLHIQQR